MKCLESTGRIGSANPSRCLIKFKMKGLNPLPVSLQTAPDETFRNPASFSVLLREVNIIFKYLLQGGGTLAAAGRWEWIADQEQTDCRTT